MDGQQRLNAVMEFYDNSFKLTGLETWKSLNGLTYRQCPPRIKSGLDRRRISANVLLAESASTAEDVNFIRRTVFERLNTGGTELNSQEFRNSLYSGPFNDLIVQLAGNPLFNEIWGIPSYESNYRKDEGYISAELAANRLFSRMGDCEIILRFFALRRPTTIKGSMKAMMDRCMESNRDINPEQVHEFNVAFTSALELSYSIFGDQTFKTRDESGKTRHSQPLFDAVMVAADSYTRERVSLIRNRGKIKKALQESLKDLDTYEIIVGKPNTAASVEARIAVMEEIFSHY